MYRVQQKHTQTFIAEQQHQELQQRNHKKISQMNVAAAESSLSSSTSPSVFSSYAKDSYQQQQMDNKQHTQQQMSVPSSSPSAAASSTIKSATTPISTTPPTTPPPPVHIPYKIDWIFERLKSPTGFWYICSQLAIFAVGLFSKFVLGIMNKTRVYNKERLIEAVANRPSGVPLVTVSNHHSCFDDPGLWGILPARYVCNTFKIRWSMAAHDICFTNKYHSWFFMFGKCIPVVRGIGVYQDAINLCIQKAKLGHWVHVFPEGKVNMTKEEMRLKWGVGRIIYESTRVPIILPMWHEGMDDVLPNVEPYILKWGKKVTLNIGKPIDMNDFIEDLKCRGVPEPEARKLITDKIQDVFHHLRLETEQLHKQRN
ncbi:tafazzin, phospholipid-lysophospholipid transacylase isoform X3 [Haematobia irritans]|uniref:tafazzin, phospholipid-lysophospholipid transacylase isoform X3 n=1 Tax=Haematobia irritans TaxID=7368 RepID=UPI003F4FE496